MSTSIVSRLVAQSSPSRAIVDPPPRYVSSARDHMTSFFITLFAYFLFHLHIYFLIRPFFRSSSFDWRIELYMILAPPPRHRDIDHAASSSTHFSVLHYNAFSFPIATLQGDFPLNLPSLIQIVRNSITSFFA